MSKEIKKMSGGEFVESLNLKEEDFPGCLDKVKDVLKQTFYSAYSLGCEYAFDVCGAIHSK